MLMGQAKIRSSCGLNSVLFDYWCKKYVRNQKADIGSVNYREKIDVDL